MRAWLRNATPQNSGKKREELGRGFLRNSPLPIAQTQIENPKENFVFALGLSWLSP